MNNSQKTVVILGGGMGGLAAANILRKKTRAKIILIDKNENHVFTPSFLWVMLGKRNKENIQKPLSSLKRKNIEFINDEVVKIEPENKTVRTKNQIFQYDYLIISLGAETAPEKIPGLPQSGFNLYELSGITEIQSALENFTEGKIAIVVCSLPFKCPTAPYEAAFLIDEHFRKKAARNKVQISVFTPESLPMPAAGPENGEVIKAMLEARSIKFQPEFAVVSADKAKKELSFNNGEKRGFDLLIFIPPHQGSKTIQNSGIGDESGWIPVDAKTLKTKYENIYAIGDCNIITLPSGKPLPKAGVFAHFEAETAAENISRELKGFPGDKKYDGRGYCFLETGYGKAGLANGRFYAKPSPIIKMNRPARIWHWGKILFEKYWLWKWF